MIDCPEVDEAAFKKELMDGVLKSDDDGLNIRMKRPAGEKILAIQDKQSDTKSDATSGNKNIKKRPAASVTGNMSKKPAAALTEENLVDHDEKNAEQNNQVNKAVENCLKQLQANVTMLMTSKHQLNQFAGSSSQMKIKDAIMNDLTELQGIVGATLVSLRQAFVTMSAETFMEEKITLLNNAATHITDISSLTKYATNLINAKQ